MPELGTEQARSVDLFEGHADFDPAGDFQSFLKGVPAKWVVYLLSDADDRPVQLLCVKNLRYSLERRLGGDEAALEVSKRVNYREIVRRVHWRRVDSAFEADWVYYEAAREIFPRTYRGMVGCRPAWFVHVNPDSPFPRYVKTTDLAKPGVLLGPLEDKHAAAGLIEMVEDAFDLCRYYNILTVSPNAKACAYKEMGKCPAPCDGTVSMRQYRSLVDWSARSVVEPLPLIRDHTRRMQQAAGELRFEMAAKIKALIDQLGRLGKGRFRHVAMLKDFQYLSLQNGPREGLAKVFLVTLGRVDEIAGLVAEPTSSADLLRLALQSAADRQAEKVDPVGAERIGVVARHLFAGKNRGVFLRLDSIDEKAVAKGYRDLARSKTCGNSEAEQ
jgi:excinuclease UvrABC nuclease subunit